MLTKELAIANYDWQRQVVVPDRLTQRQHGHYRAHATKMLEVYRTGEGRTRRDLHRDVRRILADEDDCPTRRIDAFCKLLDETATFATDKGRSAAKLRQRVFRLAAGHHPLVTQLDGLFDSCERTVKQDIANELGMSWPSIERSLFADVIEFHRLQEFAGYDSPEALLSRYNVAQFQAALYGAVQMTVWATVDFKVILRAVKLARLMHSIARLTDGRYRLVLDGPASVLRETRRYGVAMAKFLPSLLACRQWKMHAKVKSRRGTWQLSLRLTSEDGLGGTLAAPCDFDSDVERSFAEKWGVEAREGWTLIREADILHRGQKVFLPDFVFQHEDGRRVLLEIVGFWTPEYLAAKATTLRAFADHPILLAVAESVQHAIPHDISATIVLYKSSLKVGVVLDAVRSFR
jgi:predicted nuclease of restriction endonuclease-like RecB superfamily